MKTKLLISALTLSLFANAATAGTKPTYKENEENGTGIGLIVGAVLGGPLGAAAAGYIGNRIGESMDDNAEVADLQAAQQEQMALLSEKDQQLLVAEQQLTAMKQQYVDRQMQYEQQMAQMHNRTTIDNALAVSLQFRTGSTQIEPQYQEQLKALAAMMKTMPDFTLDLSGYADRRGEEQYNQQLSIDRANAVSAFLIRHGVNPERLNTAGFGESQPLQAQQSHQSDFFDRRVLLKLSPGNAAVAKND